MRSSRRRQLVTLALLGTSTGLLAAGNVAPPFDRAYPEHVREGLLTPPALRFSRRMVPLTNSGPGSGANEARPTFIAADSMRGLSDVETVAEVARRKGCPRYYWMTQENNARARALYDKVARWNGFIRYDYTL